jgi:hypothetical protein
MNPRDQGAENPSLIFSSLHVSAQPEGIVGHTARHYQRRTAQLQKLIARGQQAEGINWPVRKYPRVLAVTSPLHGNYGAMSFGDTHQTPWKRQPAGSGVHDISAQNDASGM